MITKNNNSISTSIEIFILFIIAIIFPRISLIFCIPYFLFKKNISDNSFFVLKIIISFCVGSIAYGYAVFSDTAGDIYRYYQMYNFYSDLYDNNVPFLIITATGNGAFYYSWVALNLFSYSCLGSFHWLNFISLFLIIYLFLSIVRALENYYNNSDFRRLMFFKLLCMFSIYSLCANYRSLLAFSFIAYAITLFFIKKKKILPIILIIIGIGFHLSTIVVVIIFLFSLLFKKELNKKMVLYFFLIGVLIKPLLKMGAPILNQIPFVGEKISYYITGEWADYRIIDKFEILFFIYFGLFVFFLLYSFNLKIRADNDDSKMRKYLNFIIIYLVFCFTIIGFRTLATRYLLSGLFLFLPLFAYFINSCDMTKKRDWMLLFLLVINPAILVNPFFPDINYIVGQGFPYNIFESTYDIFSNL